MPFAETAQEAQAAIDSAAGPGYTVYCNAAVNYGDLRFNHARPCTLVFGALSTVKTLNWSGGEPRGNHIVRGPKFRLGTGIAIVMLDDVSNVLVEDADIEGDYTTAYAIERANNRWEQPRNIRIHRLNGRGMTNLGCIVGASDRVFEDDIQLDCRRCMGGNGAYHHDKQATNHRVRGMKIIGENGIPACGIRAGGYSYEDCFASGCVVNFSAGHNVQSVTDLTSVNAKRYEFECGDYGPLYVNNLTLVNDLPASQLDQGGPGHHNINIGSANLRNPDGTKALTLARLEIRNATARTAAPESGTCFASSAEPEYGAVIQMEMAQARPGSPIEWGRDVASKYTFITAIT